MTRNTHTLGAAVFFTIVTPSLIAWGAAAQGPARRAARATATSGAVATVGSRRIPTAQFERDTRQAYAEYERMRGYTPNDDLKRLIRRQTLERMIRTEMLVLEARKQAIPVSAAEIDAEFRTHPFFNEGGAFNAARFEKVKAANSPEYQATLAEIRGQIAAKKLAQRIEKQYAPDPADLRAEIEQALTHATVDNFALRAVEFDGRYPEPSERDVLAYYRAHARDFARIERAELSVIQIGDASPARARQVADSLIAAIQSGTTFQGASAGYGGARSKIHVTMQEFPPYWQGDEATRARVFRSAPGTVLPAPVPGRDGWLVVRVDAVSQAGTAPLRDVARDIRRLLREEAQASVLDKTLRGEYESRRSMLKTPAYKVRWVQISPASVKPGEPTAVDLQSYYRSHLADYSAYDAAAASIRTRTLEEVKHEVREGWKIEQRSKLSRLLASRIEDSWSKGRRDKAAEAQAGTVREAGPLPLGGQVDTGTVARVVSDSLSGRQGALGVGVAPVGESIVVFHVFQAIKDYAPSFEEYRNALERGQGAKRAAEEEQQARAMFERDPSKWATGKSVHFEELLIPYPDPITVPLTRREVEEFHMRNLDLYSAPEQIRVRHILVSPEAPGPEADAAARKKAEGLLQRIKAGEDFAELARRFSDDPPTRDKGGDLGFFGHGVMLEPFERAAFALRGTDVSGLVRTEAGYHIIKLVDRLPLVAEPLEHVYANVGSDAAIEKAARIGLARADSIMRVARTPAALRAIGAKLKMGPNRRDFNLADIDGLPKDVRAYVNSIVALQPGEVLPRPLPIKGVGVTVAWLDSIGDAKVTQWEDVRDRVLDNYRRQVVARALAAKRAELDSLERAGWSVDSLATLWGGFERVTDVVPGKGIVGLGGRARIDSLVFGGAKPAALAPGQVSSWVELDRGVARVKLVTRVKPGLDQVAAKVQSQRRLSLEHKLEDYYARLKLSYPVHILDSELAATTLPPLPERAP